jgi:4-hydroxy-3-polyprenylbenzoate decarboxylase
VEIHLIISSNAPATIKYETGLTPQEVEALADHSYRPEEMEAPLASGSYGIAGMVVAPCSIKTLSAIAHSFAETLLVRAADVMLKEGRPLILMVRETPLHRGHLKLMDRAAEAGAVIFPPVPAMYGKPQTVEELVRATAARMISRLGIENEEYPRWEGNEEHRGHRGPQ